MARLVHLLGRLRSIPLRYWFLALGGVFVVAIMVVAGFVTWDYTNSPPFCGTTCHTMPPHYESYLRSSHARVSCVECHIGRTSFGVQFTRKAVDAQFVYAYVTGQYEYPLQVKGLQPARESCEKCHWPEKFAWDKVVTKTDFQPDETNTPVETTLVVKTGGGTTRQGLGHGIHWHVENPIDFVYTDDQQQKIPWIQVTNPDGTKTVYSDVENPLTPEQVAQLPQRRMDCIDCHNRVSHNFLSPEQALNTALENKVIDSNIPQIKQKGVEVLTPLYDSTDQAKTVIGNLEQFYQQTYPDYYKANTETVQNAVQEIQGMYPSLHFPDQGLDWTTHPDNLGHKEWPGCFRCHDGKHFTESRDQAVRLECNLCHTIPVVTKGGESAPAIPLEQIQEPDSHKSTFWLIEHRTQFDATCQQCHDTRNAGSADNSSFCSNSACHGTEWKFAGFDAPALAKLISAPVPQPRDPNAPPADVPHPVGGNPDCLRCHGLSSKVRPMPSDHEGRTADQCLYCHTPAIPSEAKSAQAARPPAIPHDLRGRAECLGCHASGQTDKPQIPQDHKDRNYTNGQCMHCHQPKKAGDITIPTPVPGQTPAAAPQGDNDGDESNQ